ncbi:zinc finger BED domain-containing protein RICESLEEPER 2-like isoform X3 [Cucumis melo var. makuwa]|uniref:Zinc finger BED domain-containing protein RICESLEEPER 2-like isoform X3 n=1 Tax=Cucumis melo var. makuwa TaxID=1194695 RepID=A0A5A7SP27_CUCMM|nr:zinc finger BED domain-containing protein RICESLEEPER 2-like isoform X3 [Cucumis melo var. makuwa]
MPIEGFGFQSQSEIPSISSSGSYKAHATVHDRFKQSNKTCLDDAKTEVARYLDEARIDCMGDEYLDLLTWWKVNSSRFKIISQVAKDIYSIPISTVPSESAFSTRGRSKPLDDMTEEIDGAEEIDEEFINIGKKMEAAFENLNNDSMWDVLSDGNPVQEVAHISNGVSNSTLFLDLCSTTVWVLHNTLMRYGSVCGGKIESGEYDCA